MLTIWKFPLPINDTVEIPMPVACEILSIDLQGNDPTIWALVDPDGPLVVRTFKVRGTGYPVEPGLRHLATFQQPPFVWHVFEDEK